MGCLLSCLACQALSCCSGLACSCCGKVIPCSKSITTRAMYVLIFFISAVVQYVLNNWSYKLFSWIPELDLCADNADQRWCVGALSAARVCFAVCLFHLVLCVVMFRVKNSTDPRASVQDGWWLVKFGVIIVFTVLAYLIPNEFFVVFGWIALFGAAIFIIIQLMLLIDFAYTWAEAWIDKFEEEHGKIWYVLLLGSTATMYAACIAACVLLYVFFYSGSECWMNIMFPTVNLAICFAFSLISIHPRVQEAHVKGTGLLQSAVVSTYATYLIWSAITSEPTEDDFKCNPLDQVGASMSTLLMGAAFTIVAVCFTTIRSATQGNGLLGPATADPESNMGDSKMLLGSSSDVSSADEAEQDDEVEEVTYNYSFFHFTFLVGSMFVYMLITDWATVSGSSDNFKVDHGFAAVWVKVVSSWLASLLYVWTLVAPLICVNREF